MFFILNNEGMVIAADQAFLEHSDISSIHLLGEEFRAGNFLFYDKRGEYRFRGKTSAFTKTPIKTVFGDGVLYDVITQDQTDEANKHADTSHTPEKEIETLDVQEEDSLPEVGAGIAAVGGGIAIKELLDDKPELDIDNESDELLLLDDKPEPEDKKDSIELVSHDDKVDEDIVLDLDDSDKEYPDTTAADEKEHKLTGDNEELISLAEEDELISLADESVDDEIDLYTDKSDDDLIKLVDKEETEKEDLPKTETPHAETSEEEPSAEFEISSTPFADYDANARLIGIATADYHLFLEQFANEAVASESNLRGMDLAAFRDSAASLKDAAQLLNLSQLTSDLEGIQNATSDEKESLLDSFFQHIKHIHRDIENAEYATPATEIDYTSNKSEIATEDETIDLGSNIQESHLDEQEHNKSNAPELALNEVEAIPFDFSAKTAADELGLPETLVDEFVSDFVDQARENISIFHTAQQNGDLETIQKTAHLLKGAASNLRIDPLAQTLESLQHNDDLQKVEPLFHEFLGQLKTLENFTGKSSIFKG